MIVKGQGEPLSDGSNQVSQINKETLFCLLGGWVGGIRLDCC